MYGRQVLTHISHISDTAHTTLSLGHHRQPDKHVSPWFSSKTAVLQEFSPYKFPGEHALILLLEDCRSSYYSCCSSTPAPDHGKSCYYSPGGGDLPDIWPKGKSCYQQPQGEGRRSTWHDLKDQSSRTLKWLHLIAQGLWRTCSFSAVLWISEKMFIW